MSANNNAEKPDTQPTGNEGACPHLVRIRDLEGQLHSQKTKILAAIYDCTDEKVYNDIHEIFGSPAAATPTNIGGPHHA